MNKHLILMGMAAAMVMASCSSDDLAGGNPGDANGQPVGNSDIPVMLSAGQLANQTRVVLGDRDETGKLDGNFHAKGLGVFCLATGKIAGTEDISWRKGYDNPNFLWMENVKADAEVNDDADLLKRVTNLKFYDAAGNVETNYFYPMGSQYSYTFYGYYPYSPNVKHAAGDMYTDGNYSTDNQYHVNIDNLDGRTDVIWGKSQVAKTDPDSTDAYSAKYFRDKKKRDTEAGTPWQIKNYLPQVTFKHKLMKFNIILKKGSGETTQLENLGIKSAKLLNVATKGELIIADYDNAKNNGKFIVDWSTAANTNTAETGLELKNAEDGPLSDNETGYPGPFLGEQDQVTIGDGFLVPVPKSTGEGTYEDNGYHGTDSEQLAEQGIFRLRIDYFMTTEPDKLYKAAQYEIRPSFKETGDTEGWQEGYEYDIVISVSDPQMISANATLTPWEKRTIELE